MKKLLFSVIILFFSPCSYASGATTGGVLKDASLAYGIMTGTTVIHEMAHALTVKLLYGVNSDTYIGFSRPDFPRKIPGKMTLNFVGFHPAGAEFYPAWKKDTKRTPFKDLLVAISGPIIGVLANYLILKGLMKSDDAHKYLLSKIMCLGGIIGHGAQFYPYACPIVETPSDGIRAYKALLGLLGINKPYQPAI